MFWSLLLEPGKRYTKVVDSPFHISAAVLDTTTQDNGIVRVIVDIGDTEAHIANLSIKHGILQSPLDLQFESGSRISFYTMGAKSNVHLSGYMMFEDEELLSDDEDDISEEEEVPTLVPASIKRKPEDSPAEVSNKKAKVPKVNETTPKNAAVAAAKVSPPKPAAAAKASPTKPTKVNAVQNKLAQAMDFDEDDDDDEEDELDSDEGEEEEEEDDDDDDEEEEEEDEDDESDDDEEEEEEDEMAELNVKKAKQVNAVKPGQTPKKDQVNVFKMEKTPKGAKAGKGDKQTPKGAVTQSDGVKTPKSAKTPGGEGAKTPKGAKTPGGEGGAQDKGKKTPKQQQGTPAQNGKTPKTGTAAKEQAKSPQTPKTVKPGGVVCEDLVVGKGPEAKSGKMVNVYYEGRLVANKKMFDKCDSGKGFKFRLGGGEVIKGWDVGVSGMRIGGKRKITCPPHMAYGKKGAPPDIPGNAALSFVVELKGIS